MSDPTAPFVPVTVLKRDEFSETVTGHLADAPGEQLVLRKLSGVPVWARPIAWFLARKEIRGLRAVAGIAGCPRLLRVDRDGLLRSWSEGAPLNLAKPADPAFYRDAKRLLREMRRRGVTHNDLAKPQNWLQRPDGLAAVIDFQLASLHTRRGWLYRTMAYEDLRHLLKQKRAYARHLLTPTERRILARRSLPSRIWMATGKRAYNFVTRRLLNWSDSEGGGDRMRTDAPAATKALQALTGVRGLSISPYSLPARGVGLYAFVETDLGVDALRRAVPEKRVELLHVVDRLPRDAEGAVREDILHLIAMNRLDELDAVLSRDPELREDVAPILASRLNLTDRRLKGI